jgi:parallel beta-helix repeat protein
MLTSVARFGAFIVLTFGVALAPGAASAQTLSVSPGSVSAQSPEGQDAPSQTVTIRNSGGKALKWAVGATPSWLSVSPTRGTQAGNLVLTFRSSSMSQGSYRTSFDINSNGGSTTVNVQLDVTAPVAPVAPTVPTLTVSCPANQSVASLDGNSVVVNYSATTAGGVAPVTVTGNPASGSAFPVGATSVAVTARSSDGQTASCSFAVTVTYTPTSVSPDGAMVPTTTSQIVDNSGAVWTIASNGAILRNGTSAAGGYGSKIYWKNNTIYVYGTDSNWYQWTGSGWTNIGPTQPGSSTSSGSGSVSASGVGPQSTITCPAGAVAVFPGASIQNAVNSYGGSTTFCLRAGVHYLYSSITPKTGDVFVGEYGAILDGYGWSTSDSTQAAFRAHNQDIDYVTIRNLVIRNMPQRGIHAFYYMADHWTIEYNEIAASGNSGIVLPPSSLIRNNYIHHNNFGGYGGQLAHNATIESNEIAYNAGDQKLGQSANVTVRNNFIHHNTGGAGIWFDSNNTGTLIEGNRVEDNGWIGIFYEISSDAIIRNNTIRRSGEAGIMLSVSKNVQIYNNTLDSNFRGITYFLNCGSLAQSADFDLTNDTAHDNVITVGTQSGAFANSFGYISSCTSTQVAPYLNGSKNLTFSHNTYRVPSNAAYWGWGPAAKYWTEWQALGQDVTGTMSQ